MRPQLNSGTLGGRLTMAGSTSSESLDQLRRVVGRYPRMHGYYLLNLVPLPEDWRDHEETALTAAIQALDDHPWPPPEVRPDDQRWVDYEVPEPEASAHVVAALVGGSEVGHARDTIPISDARPIWEAFRALFSTSARFFMGVGLGDSKYVFQQGAVVVDDHKAGCLCVIESD
jgi:hypothetical protein